VFVQASEITRLVPSPPWVAAVWVIAGVLTLCGALVCAELASAFPRTGGVYVFLREIYSPALGFLWGWAMFWAMHTGILAAIAVVFARYAAYFLPVGDIGLRVIAIGAIVFLSAINSLGVSLGSRVQTAITGVKVLAVLAIILAGVWLAPMDMPGQSSGPGFVDLPLPGSTLLRNFLLAVAAGLFAFGGWHMVTYTAEETEEPERTIPRALIIGIVIITLCYVGLNAVYLDVLPIEMVISSTRVAADVFVELIGPQGGGIIAAVVMLSAFGALNGIVLMGPRVYYSMAQDGLLFEWATRLHPTFRAPGRAILLQAAWAAVLVATGSYRALFTRVIFTEWIFFALLAIGVIVLRRRAEYVPRWPMPGVPLVPLLFALASFGIVLSQLTADPINCLIGLAIVAAGLPVYWLWTRRSAMAPHKGVPYKP